MDSSRLIIWAVPRSRPAAFKPNSSARSRQVPIATTRDFDKREWSIAVRVFLSSRVEPIDWLSTMRDIQPIGLFNMDPQMGLQGAVQKTFLA
jgi:hypothetical protein